RPRPLRRALLDAAPPIPTPRTLMALAFGPGLLLNLASTLRLRREMLELAWIVRKKPIWLPS
ncbi:MAG TPA: hypothetical protein VN106_03470, partial [Sphingomicrobium sp.]|nr:hypothetical protein [Sphingomicrobium sp.]